MWLIPCRPRLKCACWSSLHKHCSGTARGRWQGFHLYVPKNIQVNTRTQGSPLERCAVDRASATHCSTSSLNRCETPEISWRTINIIETELTLPLHTNVLLSPFFKFRKHKQTNSRTLHTSVSHKQVVHVNIFASRPCGSSVPTALSQLHSCL